MGLDVATTLAKWSKNAMAAGESYKKGIAAVTESPTAKAANRAQQYVEGVNRSVAEGRFQSALRAVSLQEWQDAATNKGGQRYAGGIKAAESKMGDFLAQFLPFAESVKKEIDRMPKGSDAEADARMLAAVQKLRQFKFVRRGG